MMTTTTLARGLDRWYEYRARFEQFIDAMKNGPEPNPLMALFFEIVLDQVNAVISSTEEGRPVLSSWYGNGMEIYAAMDIDFYCPVDLIFPNQPFTHDVVSSHSGPSPDDTCGLIRQGAMAVANGLVPTPTQVIAMLEPCDAQLTLHEIWQKTPEWSDIPVFALDPPYGSSPEDFEYFAGELKRMTRWLEEQTGRTLTYENLKRVCEETNRVTELWGELCELQRTVPAPTPSFMIPEIGWNSSQHVNAGSPKVTKLFEMMVGLAEQNVAAGIGALPDERLRVYWADLDGSWPPPVLGPWLAETFGAVVVNSFQGEAAPYGIIDTTSIDTMMFGLARRSIHEVPMIRQARGSVAMFDTDIKRVVRDYSVDCVLFPGHKGHKDQSASIGFLRDICREAGVPLLAFTSDIFDPTWMTPEQVKRRITEFFAAQGWDPIDR
jgi:benzoyl-CoA reductase subunit B